MNVIESFYVNSIDKWYSKSLAIKCPFLRRRMSDLLDSLDKVMRFLIIRHKSLDLIGPPLSFRSTGRMANKCMNLSTAQIAEIIRKDWREDTEKGYLGSRVRGGSRSRVCLSPQWKASQLIQVSRLFLQR